MKGYAHTRLSAEEEAMLARLERTTGASRSELMRRGLRLLSRRGDRERSALALAGPWVGRYHGGPKGLATHGRHLRDFGK